MVHQCRWATGLGTCGWNWDIKKNQGRANRPTVGYGGLMFYDMHIMYRVCINKHVHSLVGRGFDHELTAE